MHINFWLIVIDKKKAQPAHANLPRNRSFGTFQREFRLDDIIEFCVNGVEVFRYELQTLICVYKQYNAAHKLEPVIF